MNFTRVSLYNFLFAARWRLWFAHVTTAPATEEIARALRISPLAVACAMACLVMRSAKHRGSIRHINLHDLDNELHMPDGFASLVIP